MAEQFYTLVTNVGKAKIANSILSGKKVNLTTLKVGDSNGSYYNPTESQTDIVHKIYECNITSVEIDSNNSNWINITSIIPSDVGGFTIREVGIFDDIGSLIAIGKYPETYKPIAADGSTKELYIKMTLEFSNTSSVTLKVDPTVILATKKDIDILSNSISLVESEVETARGGEDNLNARLNKFDMSLSEMANEISNDGVITPAVSFGMNNVIKNTDEVPTYPRFVIKGRTLINILGREGNCEDVSKWVNFATTSTLDATNKVFGSNGIKITLTSAGGSIANLLTKYNIDNAKYYLISAYLKNGNATTIQLVKDNQGGGANKFVAVTDTTTYNRVGLVLQPSDLANGNYLSIQVNGSASQYAYVDGIAMYEITAAEYALGANTLLANYPYVDSYTCLQNPYIEIRNDNIIRNGNTEEGLAWYTPYDSNVTLSIVNNKFQLVTAIANSFYSQALPLLKSNTNYYLKGNTTGTTTIGVQGLINGVWSTITTGTGAFNAGNSATSYRFVAYNTTISTGTFDSIHLVEGTEPPTAYKSCKIDRTVIEGRFATGDDIVYENGKVTGLTSWKHKTLYGKDYDWQFKSDYAGYKTIILPSFRTPVAQDIAFLSSMTKYDGTIIPYDGMATKTNTFIDYYTGSSYPGNLAIAISDAEAGWGENLNPNNDEAKLIMNGWKAKNYNAANSRYILWQSIVDGTYPAGAITTTTTSITNAGANIVVAVADASKFAVGDSVCVLGYIDSSITAISGNNITVAGVATQTPSGATLVKQDNGATKLDLLNYCKNNVAPGFEGWQLHYKTANSERVTDLNAHIHGDIPTLEPGDNYVYIDSGIVLGEVASPGLSVDSTQYRINSDWVLNKYTNRLKYKTEIITNISKNGNIDNLWASYLDSNYGYGKYIAYTPAANFDPTATYTVDYKILATIAPAVGTVECSYGKSITETIRKLSEEVESRQPRDNTLDRLTDLGTYEVIDPFNGMGSYPIPLPWAHWYPGAYITLDIPFSVPKDVKPTITINTLTIYTGNAIGNALVPITPLCSVSSILISKTGVKLRLLVTDTTAIANIKSYGVAGVYKITADCSNNI